MTRNRGRVKLRRREWGGGGIFGHFFRYELSPHSKRRWLGGGGIFGYFFHHGPSPHSKRR